MRWWVVTAAAALAACSDGEADYNRSSVPPEQAEAQAAIEEAVARNGVATTARVGVPVGEPSRTAARERAFPTEFVGYWGVNDTDCELANTAAIGRINVDADTIRFHEGRARVRSLQRRSPYEVVADLRMSSAGRTWERRDTFTLEAGGTQLVRSEPPLTQRYRRC